jgi:excisionase family DNA binding protein
MDNITILSTELKRTRLEAVLYTPAQVADILNLSAGMVRQMCREGEINSIKIGRAVRIHKDDLQQWLDGQRGAA